MSITTEQILDALRNVDDPDLKKDIVTLGMVRDIAVEGKKVSFTVVLTTPACPMKDMIQRACINAVKYYVDKEAEVDVTMTANVTTKRSGPVLPNVRNVIAVSSGKGGVGKSTVAANLAAALAMQGARVGLVDADIYGPSMPIMFNVVDERPQVRNVNGRQMLVPVESYGVKLMSIGFFIENQAQAVVWRGPMAVKALNQLFGDVDWGELDYMIIDLPPGTGDIHLSLVGSVPLTGAVVVSTPQAVALSDAHKGVTMFRLESVNVPVIGMVENMAWFTPAELPENKYFIFGRDGAKELAARLEIPLLGQIPLVQSICESGDAGRPAVLQKDTPQAIAFTELAQAVAQQVAIINSRKAEVAAG